MTANPPAFWDFPYTSQRMPLLARNVVSTSQPLASSASASGPRDRHIRNTPR